MKPWLKSRDEWQKSSLLEAYDVFMSSVFKHLFSRRVPQNAAAKMWKMIPWVLKQMHRAHWRITLRMEIREAKLTTKEALSNYAMNKRYEIGRSKWGPAWDWAQSAPADVKAIMGVMATIFREAA